MNKPVNYFDSNIQLMNRIIQLEYRYLYICYKHIIYYDF